MRHVVMFAVLVALFLAWLRRWTLGRARMRAAEAGRQIWARAQAVAAEEPYRWPKLAELREGERRQVAPKLSVAYRAVEVPLVRRAARPALRVVRGGKA